MFGPIEVVPYKPRHLKRVLEIECTSFGKEAYPPELFRELYQYCSGLFFVAKRSRRIVGYLVACIGQPENPRRKPGVDAGGRIAEIISIAVEPEHRKNGVGSALMAHTLQAVRKAGVGSVDLTVRASDRAVIQFYRHFGFTRIRTIRAYYEDGGDGLLMSRNEP